MNKPEKRKQDRFFGGRELEQRQDFYVILAVAALSLAINPAVAFAAGFILAKSLEKKWVQI